MNLLLIVLSIGAGFATTAVADWQPLFVFAALLVLAVASDALIVSVRNLRLSGSFSAMVLAMALLGPLPAVVIGLATIGIDAWRARLDRDLTLSNLSAYAAFNAVGGIVMAQSLAQAEALSAQIAIVVAVFMGANFVNFLIVWHYQVEIRGAKWGFGLRNAFAPVIPAQLALALTTGGVYGACVHFGSGAILTLGAILLVFQWLVRVAMAAQERGEEVEQRNRQLASLQVGLISTMLKTLSLRDHMTARHSAAVARYAREMAGELGLDEAEVDLIHTAALFHDIGKFIFPDDILLADTRLTDEQYAIVRRHPEVGAELISEIEGYGPVAEIVRHHHERIDGRGYPDGLSADEIPLGSRIIAVADVYDVITARDTYRNPVSHEEAIAELYNVAGTQLDAQVVDVFCRLLETRGVRFQHSTSADFEAELQLDLRVRDYAAPRVAA